MDALIVDGDEALGLARELADRRGTSIDEAVLTALRTSLSQAPPRDRPIPRPVRVPTLEDLTPEQRADYEAMRALVREFSVHRVAGATSDHSAMYDERGLPI